MEAWESKLAVIILNYNSADLTLANARNIRSFSPVIEIVIADNCSADDSYHVLTTKLSSDSHTYVIKNSVNSGYAAGNNFAFKFVSENLKNVRAVCISNPDIYIENITTLKKLYNALFSDGSLALITALTIFNGSLHQPNECCWRFHTKKYMMFGGTVIGRYLNTNLRYSTLNSNKSGVAYVDVVQGCFFMAKKNVFESMGCFDQGTFLYFEEVILAKKVQNAGYRSGVLLDEYIHHNHNVKSLTLADKKKKIFDMKCYYNSKKYYNKKFSGTSSLFSLAACAFLNIDYILKRFLMLLKR